MKKRFMSIAFATAIAAATILVGGAQSTKAAEAAADEEIFEEVEVAEEIAEEETQSLATAGNSFYGIDDKMKNDVPDGKPKVLVFYSYSDENSRVAASAMADQLVRDGKAGFDAGKVDIYMMDCGDIGNLPTLKALASTHPGVSYFYDKSSYVSTVAKYYYGSDPVWSTVKAYTVFIKEDGTNSSQEGLDTDILDTINKKFGIQSRLPLAINYNLNGGTNNKDNPAQRFYKAGDVSLKDASRVGYTFDGWYTDSAFTKKITSISSTDNNDYTVYAKWTANKYTIKFNGNGAASGSMSDMVVSYDEKTSLKSLAFKKPGYGFGGWYYNSQCSGDSLANGAEVVNLTATKDGVINLYAKWDIKTYTITYNMKNVGTNPGNPESYTVKSSTITLKNPKVKGYDFAGWYLDKKCTKRVKKIVPRNYLKNIKVYAKWKPYKYTVTFKANGGKGTMKTKKFQYGKSSPLLKNRFKKKGYEFVGWCTKKNGNAKIYKDKQEVTDLSNKKNGKVTLYAQWKLANYKITYKLKGGKNNPHNRKTYTVKTDTFELKPATKKGYIFKGWYKDKYYEKRISEVKQGSTGDLVVYAKWEPIVYKVIYDANGGDGDDKVYNCKYNKTYTIKENKFSRKGYKFVRWNTSQGGGGKSYEPGDEFTNLKSENDAEYRLYAQWKEISYTLSYNLNGGTGETPASVSSKRYTEQFYCPIPTAVKEGYFLMCWNTKSDGSGKDVYPGDVSGVGEKDGEAVVLYAKWRVLSDAERNNAINLSTSFNTKRVQNGKGIMSKDNALDAIAQTRAREIAKTGDTGSRLNGNPFYELHQKVKYSYGGVDEARLISVSTFTGEQAVTQMLANTELQNKLYSTSYNKYGVACYQENGKSYWVIELAY